MFDFEMVLQLVGMDMKKMNKFTLVEIQQEKFGQGL